MATLFYAYAKNIIDDWSYRYVITFPSSTVADEWWTAVSTATTTEFPTSVKRVTPQFYTHNTSLVNISTSLTTTNVATQFLGLVFFTLLNDRDGRVQSIIPRQDVTDLTSGNTFFIRSKVDPSLYWCSNAGLHIYASRTVRTRFRVGVRNRKESEGTVIIPSDDIYISLADGRYVTVNNGDSSLLVGPQVEVFKFGDFQSGFVVKEGDEVFKTVAWGETWELV